MGVGHGMGMSHGLSNKFKQLHWDWGNWLSWASIEAMVLENDSVVRQRIFWKPGNLATQPLQFFLYLFH